MINKVILIGNVGGEPKIHSNNVASFTLATTRKFRQDDRLQEETEWHNIVVFGKSVETVEKFVHKGTLLYVEGRIKTEKYTNSEGNERVQTRIVAETIKLLGKNENGSNGQKTAYSDDLP